MKIKLRYIVVVFMIFAGTSCNNWLELTPPDGLIREEFWKTRADVESVLMMGYSGLAGLNGTLFIFGEVRADMVAKGANLDKNATALLESNILPDNSLCNWQQFYKVINYCNEVIKNAPLVQKIDKTFSDYDMQAYVAEAYFIRSLTYFYLVRMFMEVPLILEPNETDKTNFYVKKESEETILNQIVSDLETQRAFAPSGGFETPEENLGRASKGAFDALLADIALWRFDYLSVIKHVEKIEVSQKSALMPNGLWFDLFFPGNTLESIFELQFNQLTGENNEIYDLTSRIAENFIPSQKAIERLANEYVNEKRGEDASIRKYGVGDYSIWKYEGKLPDGNSSRNSSTLRSANWIVYRYADVLLMKAEAYSQLERFEEAKLIIEEIRERAGAVTLEIANSTTAYEDVIMEERAVEFAFEGKRWFDVLRMGRRNNFIRKDKLIEIMISNAASTQKRILETKLNNPKGWYLPIYNKELERNLNLVQNPYYVY